MELVEQRMLAAIGASAIGSGTATVFALIAFIAREIQSGDGARTAWFRGDGIFETKVMDHHD